MSKACLAQRPGLLRSSPRAFPQWAILRQCHAPYIYINNSSMSGSKAADERHTWNTHLHNCFACLRHEIPHGMHSTPGMHPCTNAFENISLALCCPWHGVCGGPLHARVASLELGPRGGLRSKAWRSKAWLLGCLTPCLTSCLT